MKKIFTFLFILVSFSTYSQILFTEQFNYTPDAALGLANQSLGVWSKVNTGDSILVSSGNLSYTGLAASAGNKIIYGGSGTDYFRGFTRQTSGTVYCSFLLKVTSLGTLNTNTGGYTIALTDSSTNYGSTLWIRSAGASNFNIGLNPRTTIANTAWLSNSLSLNTTYLIVIALESVSGATNDISKIWLNPTSLGGATPSADAIVTNTGNDLVSIQRALLRQHVDTTTPASLEVDEMRVGLTWADVTPTGAVVSSPTLSAGTLTSFGNVCVNSTVGPNSFTVSGTDLTSGTITVGPLSGYAFSLTSGGTYTSTVTISQAGGTLAATSVFVKFTPIAAQSYSGNISISGGGATAINVAASGSGVSATSFTTGSATAISTSGATINGTLVQGCSLTTAYGVEYSTSSTFTPGTGTAIASTNLSGSSFTVVLSGLSTSTTYYYVVYVTTANGTTYGTIQSFTTQTPSTGGSGIVISQVYGAGGNLNALYKSDYVELHNKSNTSETLSGCSIQYASVSQTGNWTSKSLLPTLTIPAGGYYLIRMTADTSSFGVALVADFVVTPFILLSAKNGRVALVSDTTLLSGCPSTSNIIDLVGYGPATVCSETAPTDTLSISRAAFRNNNGCDDTNNNLADFTIASPSPRNSASPVYLCGTVITTPTLTASSLTAFGNICINATAGPNSFSVSGTDLTAGDITVGPLSGFTFSSATGGTYTSTLTISQSGGTLSATTVYVKFNPTAVQSYNGNIPVSGGGATAVNVAASGSGSGSVTPAFNQVAPVCAGTQFSLPTTSTNGVIGSWLPVINNQTTTTYTFTPNVSQCATNTTMTVVVNPSSSVSATPVSTCGSYTWNGVTYTNSGTKTWTGVNVNGCDSVVTINLTITQSVNPSFNQVSPICTGGTFTLPTTSINGITGSWLPAIDNQNTTTYTFTPDAGQCAVTASMTVVVSSVTTATTGSATAISTSGATVNGTLLQGCAAATGYGIEYGTISFTPGTGTQVASTNLSGTSFSVVLSGLSASTTYYYVVYVTTSNGTVFGTIQTFTTQTPSTGGSGVVISQVYGGGGGSTGTFNADYVELHNNSGTAQDISGYKIIYGSSAGTLGSVSTNNFTFPSNVIIPPGGYLLVASAPGTGLANLPVSPDFTFTLNMSGTNGKIAFGTGSLQSNTSYASQPAGSVLDFVGYGTASEYETAATGALSSTSAAFRNDFGCQDTDDNLANFTINPPLPRNSASPVSLCGPIVGVPRLVVSSLDGFADVCPNVTAGPNTFTISGTDLTIADINVGPLNGYAFSLTSGGPYTSTITVSQIGGTLSGTTVYVQFTPTLTQSYNGNIPVVGGGANTVNVSATGSGAITPPTVLTADSIAINSNTAILRGKITGVGCDGNFSSILTYGIEYSGLQNFPVGSGIKVRSILRYASDSTFYSTINNLVQNTAYYYRSYITTADTIIYGQQKLYITPAIQAGLVIYGTPLHAGEPVHFSVSNVKTDQYGVRMFDMTGRLVCEKNFYLNADGFIDNGGISTRDQFILPGHIAAGVYSFQVSSPNFKIQKLVVVQ
jgi:hypothetical protein